MRLTSTFFILIWVMTSCKNKEAWKLIYHDGFDGDLGQWVVEGDTNTVAINEKQLELDTPQGLTVWFNKIMTAPVKITYEATVIGKEGPNDRVSDLNSFWLASDPSHPNEFFAKSNFRNGTFRNYDTLQLYYVGQGGHDNTKTRFRRYDGTGEKPLLPHHDLSDEKYLIVPNKTLNIQIEVEENEIFYKVDGLMIYHFEDKNPYESGYFGFRTTRNHMVVDNFKVWSK